MTLLLVVLLLCLVLGLVLFHPRPALTLWLLALATSPDAWADRLAGITQHETIIGGLKSFGIVLVAALMLREGPRRDRYNPAFAFAAMFCAGLLHGLYPGLSLLSSLRSLIGSAGPFLFSFVRLPEDICATVTKTVLWAPLFAVLFSAALAACGLDHLYVFELGAMRLGATGQPPYLAGFALIGIYAGLMQWVTAPSRAVLAALAVNFIIILLTGARAPLAIASALILILLILQGRLVLLAAAGALLAAAALFSSWLGFLRIVGLTSLGEATDLSNRTLVWPYFTSTFLQSPWVGWGMGAGKYVIPVSSQLNEVLGTNAAHDEYLRLGVEGGLLGLALLIVLLVLWVRRNSALMPPAPRLMMRLIFIGFAVHSATDNTMIATTSSAFFLWASCIFANAGNGSKPAA
jgi:O-antigen ligase